MSRSALLSTPRATASVFLTMGPVSPESNTSRFSSSFALAYRSALTKKKALESGWPLLADCSTRLVAESRSSRRSGRGAHLLLRSPKVRVTRQRTRALRRPVVLSALEPGVGAGACWCISTIVWCVRKRDTLTELLVCQNLH